MSALMVKEKNGRYRSATPADILVASSEILKERLKRGVEATRPEVVREFLATRIGKLEHEVFCVMFLDNRHRLIECEEMFRGTVNGTAVYPREILKRALALNAAALIIAHNHPSGLAEPSRADEVLTGRIKEACKHVDITVLDHIVVGDQSFVSFAERGLL